MKQFIVTFLFTATSIILTSCASKQIDLQKMKSEDRLYTGKMLLNLNGKTNKDLTCDVFLNIDLNPAFRLSPDGFYYFKTNRKKLNLNKITCMFNINGKNKWVSNYFNFEKLSKEKNEHFVTSLGVINAKWTIKPEDVERPATQFANDTKEKLSEIGQFEYDVKPNLEENRNFIKNAISGLAEPQYTFNEKIFKINEDSE